MNGLAAQVLHAKKLKKQGKEFKPIYGVEAYFHPDLDEWHRQKAEIDEANKGKRQVKEEEASGVTLEDEEVTKKGIKNILNKRRHLILLAQNQKGLNNIFKLISNSYSEKCFYRFPRIDYKMLEENNEGIIAASACLTGDTLVETSVGKIRIDELVVRVRDGKEDIYILSYDEKEKRELFCLVKWGDKTRKNASVYKIKTKSGKTIKATADHKVYTNNGWKRVDELSKEDMLLEIE